MRRDLLGRARSSAPSSFDYKLHADNDSMANTPPTFAWYLTGLVLEWMIGEGGLVEMQRRAASRAAKLYQAVDDSNFYASPIAKASRSRMNIPFTLPEASLDKLFLVGAEARGLMNLKGHRSVGGMRASLYNAVPEAAVDALISYMSEFERQHG